MNLAEWLPMMGVGYLLTVSIEGAVLLPGLSRRHAFKTRLFAMFWLTACTYPIVWLVLPTLLADRVWYLAVAETFAPGAECLLFWGLFRHTEPRSRSATGRDMLAIIVANLLSFGLGELFNRSVGWAWLVG